MANTQDRIEQRLDGAGIPKRRQLAGDDFHGFLPCEFAAIEKSRFGNRVILLRNGCFASQFDIAFWSEAA